MEVDDSVPLIQAQTGFIEDDSVPLAGPANSAIPKTASTPQGQKSAFDEMQALRYPEGKPKGVLSRAHELIGGNTGIGATGAALVANALGPQTGGLSILIPALAAAFGGAAGAATEGKSPLAEGAKEGAFNAATGGLSKIAPGAWQLGKEGIVKMFATRPNAAQAGEDLLKRKFMTGPSASSMYKQGEAMTQLVDPVRTRLAVDDILGQQLFQAQGGTAKEIQTILEPYEKLYITSGIKSGKQIQQPVSDMMTEIRRLSDEAMTATKSDVKNAAYSVREAMLQDLENSGAAIVRDAGKQARREASFKKLADMIEKSEPLSKIAALERKDSLFRGAFTAAEKEEIDRIVKKVGTVAPTGGSGVLGRVILGGLGGILGLPGAALGAHGIGALVAGHYGPELIRTMFASPKGRAFIEKVLDAEIKLGSNRVAGPAGAAGAMLARGLTASPPEEKPIPTEY